VLLLAIIFVNKLFLLPYDLRLLLVGGFGIGAMSYMLYEIGADVYQSMYNHQDADFMTQMRILDILLVPKEL
jgi:hypothetical protein